MSPAAQFPKSLTHWEHVVSQVLARMMGWDIDISCSELLYIELHGHLKIEEFSFWGHKLKTSIAKRNQNDNNLRVRKLVQTH